jgi:hypothetical protein
VGHKYRGKKWRAGQENQQILEEQEKLLFPLSSHHLHHNSSLFGNSSEEGSEREDSKFIKLPLQNKGPYTRVLIVRR